MADPEFLNHTLPTFNNRLVVLVPAGVSETSKFAQQVRWMALQQQRNVLFLAINDIEADELSARRVLATLEALTSDPVFEVGSVQLNAPNWVIAIKTIIKPGDRIVCHQGQLAPAGFGKGIPLSDYLSQEMKLQVTIMNGFYLHVPDSILNWARSLFFWFGSLAILALFSMVEFRVDHLMNGISRLLILAVLLVLEAGLIYELNKYTG